ncbi:response regulator [Oceanidesulfovibrio marinus]|uniref:HDOD domain-containing protein n=1 Tax=Oceanidesulfovibrio marinus TaxID=370038 RepID=A0A6P1ZD48_9BACT|nr:response regulator [Oceanidesulfovibrio marinus]QJT10316.1 HDOD domain-containing protein [Oceanidesulfovibrio marinus]TVM32266.1 two-component system response regulator [Oceanidesulfovibrio marinus]
MSKSHIMFVDDEVKVLEGLQRMLRPYRKEWDMTFTESGYKAMELLETTPVDVLVTDIRMPGMSGSELLAAVKERYPRIVRIVLSGHSDLECIVQSVLPAHQYLSKPCKPEVLKDVIEQALRVAHLVEDDTLRALISNMDALPVLPKLYQEISAELSKDEPSLETVAEIIGKDVGMSAEVLKLVNSSFFGFARHIGSVRQAVTMLGVNIIQSLVLTVHVFSVFDTEKSPFISFKGLWEHSIRTSNLARRICTADKCDRELADNACIAGMLHDIGKLVLVSTCSEQYNEVLRTSREKNRRVWDVEKEILGTTHAEVGAYLMGLWGMPDSVIEAIAFHHAPISPLSSYRPLTAVHVANVLDHKHCVIHENYVVPDMDMDYLGNIGVADHLPEWERTTKDYLEDLEDGGEQDSAG